MSDKQQAEPTAKLSRLEMVERIKEIIRQATNDLAEELITLGASLVKIGETLRGQSIADSRRILKSVAILEGIDIDAPAP